MCVLPGLLFIEGRHFLEGGSQVFQSALGGTLGSVLGLPLRIHLRENKQKVDKPQDET